MNDKGFKIVFFIFVVTFFIDLITTLINSNYLDQIELNYYYPLIGVPGITVLNVVVMFLVYVLYRRKKSSPTIRFLCLNSMIVTILLRLYAIRNAFQWISMTVSDPVRTQAIVDSITPEVKVTLMLSQALMGYLPLVNAVIVYFVWKIDHTVVRK